MIANLSHMRTPSTRLKLSDAGISAVRHGFHTQTSRPAVKCIGLRTGVSLGCGLGLNERSSKDASSVRLGGKGKEDGRAVDGNGTSSGKGFIVVAARGTLKERGTQSASPGMEELVE